MHGFARRPRCKRGASGLKRGEGPARGKLTAWMKPALRGGSDGRRGFLDRGHWQLLKTKKPASGGLFRVAGFVAGARLLLALTPRILDRTRPLDSGDRGRPMQGGWGEKKHDLQVFIPHPWFRAGDGRDARKRWASSGW